ncbi:MAG: hypothetical protein HC805_02235 [Alkalinema sp. RL_2_19]|nr:hypothetical protein [Alkalinema sp. RL_2_19]
MNQRISEAQLDALTQLKAERQRLGEFDYLQGVMLEMMQKPASSPCAPPQYVGRLRRVDGLPFDDGEKTHWIPVSQISAVQSRIQIGEQIAQVDRQIRQLEAAVRKISIVTAEE